MWMNGRRTWLRARQGLALFSAPLWLMAMAAGAEGDVAPVVPGLSGDHPLTEAQVGELLMTELRCAACHEGIGASGRGLIAAPRQYHHLEAPTTPQHIPNAQFMQYSQ